MFASPREYSVRIDTVQSVLRKLERIERNYIRHLGEEIQVVFSDSLKNSLFSDKSLTQWEELVVEAFRYAEKIAEMHRGFMDQSPPVSRSGFVHWKQFLQKNVTEMEKVYGDFLAISPRAVRFFDLSFQQPIPVKDHRNCPSLQTATAFFFRPWCFLQEYTKSVIKLSGIDHHFTNAAAAFVKLHNEAGVRMFQSVAGFKHTTFPSSIDFVPIQEQYGSWVENSSEQRFIKDIIEHEAWYVTKLKSVHESFIKPLEEANPPIFAEGSLPAFFLSTVDGYTEILVTHQSVLCQFFETQSLNPIVQMIRVFEILHGCVRQLHDLYSNYFSSLSDRQRSLKTMQSENTVLLSIVKAMHYPRHMDQIPTEEDDITDLPLHYFEFFTHPLQTLTSSLDTSIPSDYALHRVLIPFMRTVYNVQSKLRRSHENLADISGILEGKRRFLWMNEQIDLDLLNCDRRVLASANGIMANQSPSGEMVVLLILLDNFLVIVTLPVPNVDEYTLVRLPIACDLISSKGSELGLSLDGPDTFGTGRYQLTILHHTPSTKFNKLTLFLSKLSARLEIVNILENINSEERDQCEGEYLVGEAGICLPPRMIAKREFVMEVTINLIDTIFMIPIHKNFMIFGTRRGGLLLLDLGTEDHDKFTSIDGPYSVKQGILVGGGAAILLLGYPHGDESLPQLLLFSSREFLNARMESGLEIATDYIRSIVMPSSTELPMRLAVRQEGTVDHVTVVTKEQTIFKTSFAVRRLKIDDTLTPSWDELWTNSRISTEPSDVFAVRNGVAVVDGSGTINVLDYSNGSFTRTLLGQLNKAKLLGIFRANREEIMLCYPGNGIYIKTGNKLSKGILRSHKMISWELSWKGAAFVPPFVFGMDENFVEIRNVCTGALVQIIKVEGAIFLPSSPEIRDVRADFYREWETREKHDNVLTEDMHFELRKWGPVIVTNSRIVQLAPRLHPETLDPSFFDVVINL